MKTINTKHIVALFVALLVCSSFAWTPSEQPAPPASLPEPVEADSTSFEPTPAALAIDKLVARPHTLPVLSPELIDAETLWLARGIFSESKQPHEQALVAWVIRNRVETQYRRKQSYQDVILDPYQFSAFNQNSIKRAFYVGLDTHSLTPGWQRALSIAYHVRMVSDDYRPFAESVRHFYSERSLQDGAMPEWAIGLEPILPQTPFSIDERRFRFFDGVV